MTVTASDRRKSSSRAGVRAFLAEVNQANLVLVLCVVLLALGAVTTADFLTIGNLTVALTLAAAFGVVAIAEAFVVLAKGLDLSVGAMALVAGQLTLELMQRGVSEIQAILTVAVLSLLVGLLNGCLVAFVNVPPLFVTLGTGQLLVGGVNVWFLDKNIYTLPHDSLISALSGASVFGIPTGLLCAALVALLAWLTWSFTSYGRLIRAIGDNSDTAWLTGAAVRPLQVSTYMIAAPLAAFAGYIILARQGSIATTGTAFSPLLFTALTAVVIGGVSLSGGRGTIRGVLAGTLFIGLVDNLLVLKSLPPAFQDFARGGILLAAVSLDAWLHPRDEETAKGDDL
jgi:ribose transport system permease protein